MNRRSTAGPVLIAIALLAAVYFAGLYFLRHYADGQTPNGLGG
jgi:hypothetical protein